MSRAEAPDLHAALDSTWPPEAWECCGPLRLARSRGGGRRLTAARLQGELPDESALSAAEARMRSWGARPLFLVRAEAEAWDARLAARGYIPLEPTLFYLGIAADIAARPLPPDATVAAWPPLAAMSQIWASGGIDSHRQDAMARVAEERIAILGRSGDAPAGAAFAGRAGEVAMLHAMHVQEGHRRGGLGTSMALRAARWATARGAGQLALAVTEANLPARSCYTRLGMAPRPGYHYRAAAAGPD